MHFAARISVYSWTRSVSLLLLVPWRAVWPLILQTLTARLSMPLWMTYRTSLCRWSWALLVTCMYCSAHFNSIWVLGMVTQGPLTCLLILMLQPLGDPHCGNEFPEGQPYLEGQHFWAVQPYQDYISRTFQQACEYWFHQHRQCNQHSCRPPSRSRTSFKHVYEDSPCGSHRTWTWWAWDVIWNDQWWLLRFRMMIRCIIQWLPFKMRFFFFPSQVWLRIPLWTILTKMVLPILAHS